MTNIEYIYAFAEKHNFPKTECEIKFKVNDGGDDGDIYAKDYDIISVKFDDSLVENEIKIEDIRFDVDSLFPEDVFFVWQNDMPEMTFRGWIALGRYVPSVVQNTEFLNELEALTKEIEMKLDTIFYNMEIDEGDSDYDDDWGDSDYEDIDEYEDEDEDYEDEDVNI